MPSRKPSRSRARRPARKPVARKTTSRKPARRAAPARKTTTRKTASRKTTTRKTASRKTTARKPARAANTRKAATRKAPTRKAATRKAAARKPAAPRAAARTTTVRKAAARKPAARKTAVRKTTARRSAVTETTARATEARRLTIRDDDRDGYLMEHDQNTPEIPREPGSRPVAIGGTQETPLFEGPPGGDPFAAGDEEIAPPPVFIHDEKPVIEDGRGELLVGLAAALLAVATFLPWYRTFGEFDISGWASGTWGPVVFFLALAGVAIVGARRLGTALAFPVSFSLLLEGIGWVSVLGLLLKRFFPPENFSVVGLSANPLEMGFWVALFAAVAVAMLASRLSRNAPIVVLPGWFRSKAGKLGAGVLALAIAGGAAFGTLNDAGDALAAARGDRVGSSFGGGEQPNIEQGLPACMKDLGFETPKGVTATQGFGTEANGVCTASFTSKTALDALGKAFEAAMKSAGWTVAPVEGAGAATARLYTISAPKCGNLSIFDDTSKKLRAIQVLLGGEELCQMIQQQQQPPN